MTVIILGTRHGGLLFHHIAVAKQWKAGGKSIVITGSQYSAAAVQVAYAKRIGVPVAYRRRWGLFTPHLYFHAAKVDGLPVEDSYERLVEYIGANTAQIIGILPTKGWKKISCEQLNIYKI